MLNAPSRRRARFKQVLLVSAAIGLGVSTTGAWAGDASAGATLFQQKCAACHTIGQGDRVGPDLKGVTKERDEAWLKEWLKDPAAMIASGDPTAKEISAKYPMTMPNLGLSNQQIDDLIAYMAQDGAAGAQSSAGGGAAESAAAPAAAATAESAGSAEQGERLFTGESSFRNGGPSCAACHSIAGLGGGSMGPDLTTTYGRLGDAIITWPEAMAPMQPIFSADPLTDSEKADLLAFFKAKAAGPNQSAGGPVGMLLGLSIIGVVALGAIVSFVWRRRIIAVREPMVSGTGRWRR
ncbi:MAG: c-type cytochrome [Nitrococcus mobilis]|nr:c-type cytochrome [Nitrococcus mobilis]